MSLFAEAKNAVATIRYKPGWWFDIQDLGEQVAVVVEPPAFADSRGGSEPVKVRMTRYIPAMPVCWEANPKEMARALSIDVHNAAWELVRCMELHEAGEWFTVDGERPHDPHALPGGQQCDPAV